MKTDVPPFLFAAGPFSPFTPPFIPGDYGSNFARHKLIICANWKIRKLPAPWATLPPPSSRSNDGGVCMSITEVKYSRAIKII